jgi:hypothetical protein
MQYRPYDPIARYMSPPLGPLMAGVAMAGAGISAMGTLAGGANAAAMGRASAGEATFEAAQDRLNASSDMAAASQRMQVTQQKTNLTLGTATARAAASGINAGVGSAVENTGQIAQKGRYAAALDLSNGENAAAGELDKAQAQDYQSSLDLIGGQAAQKAATYSALGTLAGGGASAYKAFSANPPAGGQLRPRPSGQAARATRCTRNWARSCKNHSHRSPNVIAPSRSRRSARDCAISPG